MDKTLDYTFKYIDNCNMCGSSAVSHKILGQRLNCSQGLRPKTKNGISISVMKCPECELIYANPQPIPNIAEDHDFVQAWAEEYFEYDENYFSHEIATVKKLLNFTPGMKALDIGAGIGKGMRSLEKHGFDVYGIEPSANACQIAFEKNNISKGKLQIKPIEDAVFKDNTFDFINFGAVLEHVYQPCESLQIAAKWLKPKGIIFAEVPNSNYFITKLINLFNKLQNTNYVSHISPMHPPFHHFEFGIKSFEKFCEQNGCKIAHQEIFVCKTEFLPRFVVPVVDKYMEITKTGMQISIFLQKNQ